MRHRIAALAAVFTLVGNHAGSHLSASSPQPPAPTPALAQAPAAPPVTAEPDPGVRPTRLLDRAEVRLSRVELQPGAVRRVHAHDDVVYHLWVPITGSLEITIGTDAPVSASSGQAFFMKRGTAHGFRNVGTTPAALFEIFIKQTTTAAGFESEATIRALLAALAPLDLQPVDAVPGGDLDRLDTRSDDALSGKAP
jgi:mannose-6-phosphate isomerase-like protein (cupin superfamily)